MRIRDLIARCIERMRAGACATCENQSLCPAGRWQSAFSLPEDRDTHGEQSFAIGSLVSRFAEWIANASEPDDCFAKRVEDEMVPLLPKGDANAEHVARQLGLSRQTLFRRLRAEGTTFTDLLDAKRRQLAIQYVGEEGVPVKIVAWKLGFSGPAAFTRAFKRWTGTSPARFRLWHQE